jgi:F-type H+-transporting ATPase subunit gamma
MVAASKLRRAQQNAISGRPYSSRMTEVVASLASRVAPGPQSPRLLAGTGKDNTHLIIVATGDRGLAGAFNSNIVRAARRKADDLIAQGKTVLFYIVGRKGRPVIQRLYPKGIIAQFDTSEMKAPTYAHAQGIAKDIIDRYTTNGIDVVHLAYANFRSTLVQEPTVEQIIPVPPRAAAVAGIDAFCHLLEGYTSAKATAFTDMLAFEGLARLKYSLLELYHDPANEAAREDLAFAALLGGMVIANGGLTLAHGVGSVIGPRFGIPHGLACVLPLEGIMRHNWSCLDETKQARLKSLMQDNVPEDIRSLLSGLDLNATLSEFGINTRDLEEIARQSLATSSAKGNPCPCTQDELVEILKEKL